MDIKVVNDATIVRDGSTGALTASEEEYLKYKKRKIEQLRQLDKEREFTRLQNEVKDLKAMLSEMYQVVMASKQ